MSSKGVLYLELSGYGAADLSRMDVRTGRGVWIRGQDSWVGCFCAVLAVCVSVCPFPAAAALSMHTMHPRSQQDDCLFGIQTVQATPY